MPGAEVYTIKVGKIVPNKSKLAGKRIFFIIAAALLLIALAAVIFLHTRLFGNLLLGWAQGYIQKDYGLALTVKSLDLKPFALTVSLQGVEITPIRPGGSFLRSFSADQIFVDIPLSAVLSKKARLRKLVLRRPRLTVDQPRENDALIAALMKSKGRRGGAASSLRLDAVDVDGGSIEVNNRTSLLQLSLTGLTVSVRYLEKEKDHLGLLKIEGGRAGFRQSRIDLTGAELRFKLNDERVEIEKLLLRAGSSTLDGSGKIFDYRIHPEFSFEAKASARLEDILPQFNFPAEAKGPVELFVSAQGRGSQIDINGKLQGNGLVIAEIPASFRVAFKGNRDSVEFFGMVLQAAGGTVKAEGGLSFSPGKESSIRLRWDAVSLDSLAKVFPELPFSIDSNMSGNLEAWWQKPALEAVRATGTLSLTAAGSTSGTENSRALSPTGKADFRIREGTMSVTGSAKFFDGAGMGFSGALDKDQRLEAGFSINVTDLGATARAADELGLLEKIPDLAKLDISKLKGNAQLSGKMRGKLDDPRISLELEARDLTYDRIAVPLVKASITGGRRRAELTRFQADFNGGLIEATGFAALDLISKTPPKDTGLNVKFTDIDIGSFASWLPERYRQKMEGRLSAEFKVSGALTDPVVGFRTELTGLAFGELQFPRFKLEGRYGGGRLDVDTFRLEQKEGLLSGNLSLDVSAGRILACDIRGTKLSLSGFESLAPQAGSLEGVFALELHASGNFKSPEYTLNLRGEGIRFSNLQLSAVDFQSKADGKSAAATLSVPGLKARIDAGLTLERPYVVDGKIRLAGLKLSSLRATGPAVAPEEEEKTLTAAGTFRVPLENLSDAFAEIEFSGIDFKALTAMVPLPGGQAFALGGEAGGKIRVKGNFADIQSLDLAGEISKLSVSISDVTLENKDAIRFRFRDGRLSLDECRIAGEKAEIRISGGADRLPQAPELDFRISADADLSLLTPFVTEAALGGKLNLDIILKGPANNPKIDGTAELRDAFVRVRSYPILVTGVRGKVEFKNSQVIFSGFEGTANGGVFNMQGKAGYRDLFKLGAAKFTASVENFGLNYPPGLSTLSAADLTLEGDGRSWMIAGKVNLIQAYYREDILPGVELLSMAGSRRFGMKANIPPPLAEIGLNITLATAEPAIIKNNLADLALSGALKISGTVAVPLLSGRIQNAYVGEIVFGEHRYSVETFRLDFTGRETMDPNLDIVAHTKLIHKFDELDIQLRMTGSASNLKYALTSFPPRSQEELSLLILTGKSLDEFRGSAIDELSGQLIQYFADSLASPLTQSLKKLLKADVVSVEPLNIARETDPGARFTFRKRISNQAAVTYSIDVGNSQRQTWIMDYALRRNFALTSYRRDDGSYGATLKHSFSLGGPASGSSKPGDPAEDEGRSLRKIEMTGDLKFPVSTLEKMARALRPGSPFKFADLSVFVENGLRFYKENGYANARITPIIHRDPNFGVSVVFEISAGRPVTMLYTGDPVPASLKKKNWTAWDGRVPEEVNLADARDQILGELRREKYYAAEVTEDIKPDPEKTVYTISVHKGGRWRIRGFSVEVNKALTDDSIRKAAEAFPGAEAKGLWNLIYDGRAALNAVKKLYEERGFLKVSIGAPQIAEDRKNRILDISLTVKEGLPSRVDKVEIGGNTVFQASELEQRLSLTKGKAYNPALLIDDKNALVSLYRSKGYQDVDVKPRILPLEGSEDVDISYEINEGPRHTVSALEVVGSRRTQESYLRKEADLKEGDVLNLENLAVSQKKLYDTGAFQSVIIDSLPLEGERQRPGTGRYNRPGSSAGRFELRPAL